MGPFFALQGKSFSHPASGIQIKDNKCKCLIAQPKKNKGF